MARAVPGLRGLDVLRRVPAESDDGIEFVTLVIFDDEAAVATFAGPEPAVSVVPPAAQALLQRYDPRSQHYELLGRYGASAVFPRRSLGATPYG